MAVPSRYDALILISFGGPERPADVMPFLRNVVAGRGVPDDRLAAVAEHYMALGGKSPLNDQCRALLSALRAELSRAGIDLPVYWGNRNWNPTLVETLAQMKVDGVRRALAIVTSAFSSYSGCRQYREAIEQARERVGEGAPRIDKVRVFYNHPEFLGAVTDAVSETLSHIPSARRAAARLVFSAHSIPEAMAQGCDYAGQLKEASGWVARAVGIGEYDLVYQSRSGPPQVPWLGPDILDHLRLLAERGVRDVVLSPLGFLSDHMEVVWDLDHEAQRLCELLGMTLHRVATPGTAPRFVGMLRELVEERVNGIQTRRTVGQSSPRPDVCASDCCLYVPRRPPPGAGSRPSSSDAGA